MAYEANGAIEQWLAKEVEEDVLEPGLAIVDPVRMPLRACTIASRPDCYMYNTLLPRQHFFARSPQACRNGSHRTETWLSERSSQFCSACLALPLWACSRYLQLRFQHAYMLPGTSMSFVAASADAICQPRV
jgi:hypothetical protein